jgi:uncharacterized RDD family membrane protein YckC
MSLGVMKKTTPLLFLRRCIAYALDCLLAFLVTIVLFQGLTWLLTQGAWWNNLRTWITVQSWIVFSVVLPTWLYFSLAEASPWQATLGKRLLGLRVTDMNGKRLSLPHAFLRNFLKLIPWIFVHIALFAPSPSGLSVLGQLPRSMNWWWSFLVTADVLTFLYLLTPLFTGGQRSIHDLLNATCVTRATTKYPGKALPQREKTVSSG